MRWLVTETLPDEMVEIRRVDNYDLKLSSNFEVSGSLGNQLVL